jgi:hypothetical protein
VAAIGSLSSACDGLQPVRNTALAGEVVIFPQYQGDAPHRLARSRRRAAERLGHAERWTRVERGVPFGQQRPTSCWFPARHASCDPGCQVTGERQPTSLEACSTSASDFFRSSEASLRRSS